MNTTSFYTQSSCPEEDLALITKPGGWPVRFKPGYTAPFELMPRIKEDTPETAYSLAEWVMKSAATGLMQESWVNSLQSTDGNFSRTMLGIEAPFVNEAGKLQKGAELVIGHWGKGFSTPIHAHGTGYTHEEMIYGTMVNTSYRLIDPQMLTVRAVESKIFTKGTILKEFRSAASGSRIHSVRAAAPSASLHFFPEAREGNRVSAYTLETFEGAYGLYEGSFHRISFQKFLTLPPGAVVLFRSENADYFGDHYRVVVDGVEGGTGVNYMAIPAPGASPLLDKHEPKDGLTLFQLSPYAESHFHEFHAINLDL